MLWVFKIPDDLQSQGKYFSDLESYVVNHENPHHPQYKFLQSSAVIIYSSKASLPEMLSTYTEFVDVGSPDEEEIRDIIKTESAGDSSITENITCPHSVPAF